MLCNCSKCERILAMDQVSALLLPPVIRPYQDLLLHKNPSSVLTTNAKDPGMDSEKAFHVDFFIRRGVYFVNLKNRTKCRFLEIKA